MLSEWISAHRWQSWLLASLAVIAVAIAWRMGGFREARPQAPPVYGPGKTLVTGEWTLQVLSAAITDAHPAGLRAPPDGAFLVVEVRAENRTDRSSNTLSNALRWLNGSSADKEPVLQGETGDQALLRAPPSFGATVHPGIPERVAVIWKLTPPVKPLTSVRLRVIGREFIRRDSLTGHGNWLRDHPVAELALPVQDRRGTGGAP